MKKIIYLLSACVIALTLCSCSNSPTAQNSSSTTTSKTSTTSSKKPATEVNSTASTTQAPKIEAPSEYENPDIDLTVLDGTMMYAQVFEMFNNQDDYNGKVIRAKGPFSYFKDSVTNNEYFAVLVSDITACCAQGIEFRLKGNCTYPRDYPELGTELVITGVCDFYKEGYSTYLQLLNAEYTIV